MTNVLRFQLLAFHFIIQPDDIAMHIAMLPIEGLRDKLLIFAKYGYDLNNIGWQ